MAQLAFQNPFDALSPRFTMRRVLSEPLINAGIARAEYHINAVLTRLHLRGVGDLGSKTTCKQPGKSRANSQLGELSGESRLM